ncbi:DUF1648 domain-containing protein [Microbacterium gorillae]|uniref:DUF1648 domain-containing protein n=1 Tax=Microbacterium gorillae TaxID=1231063 RepID=UPI0006946FBC|nr:DUF1648 domain-containing protein [Microbacterium gorillae]
MNAIDIVTRPEVTRARTAFVLVGVALPLLVGFVATILQLQWLPDLPSPAATHWSGTSGAPDGFGPAWTYPAMMGGVTVGLVLLLALPVLIVSGRGRWGWAARFLGASAPAVVVFLAIGLTASVAIQRGVPDAHDVRDPGWELLLGAIVAVVVFAGAWFAQPKVAPAPAAEAVSDTLTLPEQARAVWTRTVWISRSGLIGLGIAVIVSVVAAISIAVSGTSTAWIPAGLAVLIAVMATTTLAFRVTVDARGLTVRALVGWPVFRIPLQDMSEVAATEVYPMADFGGWGVRFAGGGRTGVVLRGGEALEVRRRSGRSLVVTVDDAERAAAVLDALRRRGAGVRNGEDHD